MATINYNGMELEVFNSDKPVAFPEGTKAICWDGKGIKEEETVIAYVPYLRYRVLTLGSDDCDGPSYMACALLPDAPKPRRATNRELSRWLAQGNGEWKLEGPVSEEDQCSSDYVYLEINENYKLDCDILVRKWSDTEWHEPTVDYLGLEDVK